MELSRQCSIIFCSIVSGVIRVFRVPDRAMVMTGLELRITDLPPGKSPILLTKRMARSKRSLPVVESDMHGQASLSPWHPFGFRSKGLGQYHCGKSRAHGGRKLMGRGERGGKENLPSRPVQIDFALLATLVAHPRQFSPSQTFTEGESHILMDVNSKASERTHRRHCTWHAMNHRDHGPHRRRSFPSEIPPPWSSPRWEDPN